MPKLSKQRVKAFIELTTGSFTVQDAWREMNIQSEEAKAVLRAYLWEFTREEYIVKTGSRDGQYRKVSQAVEKIDWESADISNTVNLRFPFEIEKYARLYPKSIMVVTGETNAGKTAFLLNTLVLNMNTYACDLFNSETGAEQLKERLSRFEIPRPVPFSVYERYDNFADVINPDHVSIIDYMDFTSEVYLVGEEIEKIFRKLKKGVAIIGIQMPPPSKQLYKGQIKTIHRDLGYGGGFTAKKASTYVALWNNGTERGILKFIKAKNRVMPLINPNNMMFSYEIINSGTDFASIKPYLAEEDRGW